MKTSDLISDFIKQLLDGEEEGVILQRNELAQHFNVVPSQINYVIASRFTPEHGYIVESHRGGGGYIKIMRVTLSKASYIMHIVNGIGNSISFFDASVFLKNAADYGYLDKEGYALITAAISDRTLCSVPQPLRDRLRADIIKAMLTAE